MNLLSSYQLNEIIIGTIYFIIFYIIYRIIVKEVSSFDIFYSGIAFFMTYLTMNIIYNYSFFLNIY